jgi:hypothetical protein
MVASPYEMLYSKPSSVVSANATGMVAVSRKRVNSIHRIRFAWVFMIFAPFYYSRDSPLYNNIAQKFLFVKEKYVKFDNLDVIKRKTAQVSFEGHLSGF